MDDTEVEGISPLTSYLSQSLCPIKDQMFPVCKDFAP